MLAPPQTLSVTVIHSLIHSFNHRLHSGYLLYAERGPGSVEMWPTRQMMTGSKCWHRGQCLEEVRAVILIKLGGRSCKDLRKHLSLKEATSIGG